MTQFASIWAVKTDRLYSEGDTIPVSLKNGSSKSVKLSKFLYSTERKDGSKAHYYLSEKTDD